MKHKFWIALLSILTAFCVSFGLVACGEDDNTYDADAPVYKSMTVSNTASNAVSGARAVYSTYNCVSETDHNMKPVRGRYATATTAGQYEHYKCSICGKLFADADGKFEISQTDVIIPAGDIDEDPYDRWGLGSITGGSDNGKNNPFGESADPIEDIINSTIGITGENAFLYYAGSDTDIYITVHFDNPKSFEILSFTLNDSLYQPFMFEDGSDSENLILKVNVGDVSGVVEYTIDKIKYVDGTDIKDVRIDGSQTVKVGVHIENQVTAQITEDIGLNDITLNITVTDNDEILQYSSGKLFAVLYDGIELVKQTEITIGTNGVKFDGLEMNTLYQYAVVGYYDNFADGFGLHVINKKAVYTESA